MNCGRTIKTEEEKEEKLEQALNDKPGHLKGTLPYLR